jgi:putative Holliday junction resolvase
MDGTEGRRAEKTRRLGGILQKILDVPLDYWDERNTTKSAEVLLGEAGTYGKKRKDVLDAVAATVILESYLIHRQNTGAQ